MNTSDLYKFEPICVLNGQEGLHDTERNFVRQLQTKNINVFILDNLFQDGEKLMAVKYLKPKTLVLGTTGTYRDDLDKITEIFMSLGYFPKNVIFTRGQDYFCHLIKEHHINAYTLHPMQWSDDEIVLEIIDNL